MNKNITDAELAFGKPYKIGLDIHGVIDTYPEYFRDMTNRLKNKNVQIYIITGQEWEKAKLLVDEIGIHYTYFFSVVNYHRQKGTKMWQDDKKTWWMDEKEWKRTKGDFIKRNNIDIHFDDSLEYAEFMPDTCTFVLVPKRNFLMGLQIFPLTM